MVVEPVCKAKYSVSTELAIKARNDARWNVETGCQNAFWPVAGKFLDGAGCAASAGQRLRQLSHISSQRGCRVRRQRLHLDGHVEDLQWRLQGNF